MNAPLPPLTDEQRAHITKVIGDVIDLAARKDASGRTSMPIYIDDALLLAALALRSLNEVTPRAPASTPPDENPATTERTADE